MADNPTPPQPGQQPQGSAPAPQYTPGHVPMSEEFDRAKWTLPPVVPVVIALAAVAIVVAIVTFANRSKPVLGGEIAKLVSVDEDGNTMVALQVKLDNQIDKQLWVRNIDSELTTADDKKFADHAAPSYEIARYTSAFPALNEAKAEPLGEELKIPARKSYTGMLVFAYPVAKKDFDARKGLTVRIQLYDQPTLVLHQP
ncbi:MAG TPA: hypothetical protein VHN74_12340 [Candidatus Angelobacter sp.]|jgi:hypothetical protein|nr:hypothetical protein [Candidatus Angelobacter sp.]